MAAPVKRPHLSFSVEAILSLSKRMRGANDTKQEEQKEQEEQDGTEQKFAEERSDSDSKWEKVDN